MYASQTSRRTRLLAGAGALLTAGTLAAGIAGQPATSLADDADGSQSPITYDSVDNPAPQPGADDAATYTYTDAAPAQDGAAPADAPASAQAATDADTSADEVPTYPAEAAPTQGCVTVGVSGSYATTQAEGLIDRINEIRAEAAQEGITDADGNVVSGAPLSWSTGLEYAAQLRAAESSYSFSHDRPNGLGTVLDAGIGGAAVEAENLAQAADASSALELWYAEKDAYLAHLGGDESVTSDDYGHYLALISDGYTCVGLGAFVAGDGSTYLAAEFSATPSDSAQVRGDGACTQQINVAAAEEQQVSVPDVTGMAADEAQQALEAAGLTVEVVYGDEASDESQNGVVYDQDPDADTKVDAGSQVTLTAYADYQAPTISSLEDASVTAECGEAPALPATVTAEMSDGSTAEVAVTWEAVDPASYSAREGGSFDVAGTVEGFDGSAVAHIEVLAATPTSVEALPDVETQAGTAPELPATAQVSWSDGETTDELMSWDEVDPANYAQAGSFTVQGGVGQTGLTASATVTVTAAPAPTISSLEDVSVTTECGEAPALPATVTAEMSDGSTAEVAVTWEAVDPASYSAREGGSFDVAGTVEGFDGGAVAHVTVQAATITRVTDPDPIATYVGHTPDLPATVTATWSNGDTTDQPVEWEQLLGLTADGKGTWDTPGEVTLSGAVEGTDLAAHITVSVKQPGVESVADLPDVETPAGTAPQLPKTVQVSWEDGTTSDEEIDWDAVSPDSYAHKGSFTVSGTLPGADDAKVSVTVNVSGPAAIASVAALPAVTTPAGTAPALPTSASVTWDDGTTTEGAVTWDAVDASLYTARAGGEFDVHGSVSAKHGADGRDAIADVSVHVTVTPASVTSVEQPAGVTTRAKTAPTLPSAVKVTWSNGEVTDEAVTWGAVDANAWNAAGTVTVRGTVGQTGQTVSCTVTVQAPKAVSAESVNIATTAGAAPQLPTTVKVTWDDGSTTFEAVSWVNISADLYAKQGTFDVSGTAAGLSVTAHVTVNASDIVKTADATASPALVAVLGAAGVLAAAAGLILRLRGKREA